MSFLSEKSRMWIMKVYITAVFTDCFSRGQLYVACSRVGNPDNLFIYTETGTTKNIVYPQVLEN